jgi:hypothetical protein
VGSLKQPHVPASCLSLMSQPQVSARDQNKQNIFLQHNFLKKFILCIWVYHCSLQTHQKRASDPITDGCELPCGCWDLNSVPLEEQLALLTAEPSLQPPPPITGFLKKLKFLLYTHTHTHTHTKRNNKKKMVMSQSLDPVNMLYNKVDLRLQMELSLLIG